MTFDRVAQAETALANAQRIRLARAAERKRVREAGALCADGMRLVADLLDDPPEFLSSLQVVKLLEWPKRSQSSYRVRLMRAAGIDQVTTVGHLTYRQRAALVALIDEQYGSGSDRAAA